MNHARLSHSPRLQRALKALQKAAGEISSMELAMAMGTVAPGTVVSELRANGAEITCRQTKKDGKQIFYYTLVKSPEVNS